MPGEPIPGGQYTKDANGRLLAPQGKDVFGFNDPPNGDWLHDAFSQGGFIGRIGNAWPGGNAGAAFHDNLFNTGLVSNFNLATNLATVPPAILITYAALMDGPVAVSLAVDRSK